MIDKANIVTCDYDNCHSQLVVPVSANITNKLKENHWAFVKCNGDRFYFCSTCVAQNTVGAMLDDISKNV